MFEAAGLDGWVVAFLGFALSFLGGCLSLGLQSRKTSAVGLKRYLMLGVLMAIVSMASLLSTWLVVYRTPPYETGIKSGLWMSGVVCLVSLAVWQFFWFIIRRNLHNYADQRAFFKVISSMVFLAMCVGISAALIQDGTRHPNPNKTGPPVSIYTDGASSALIMVDIANFPEENRLQVPYFSTNMQQTKPTPADNPYARIQWALRLTGAPNGTARFAFIAAPGTIDENPTVVGATQVVSKLMTQNETLQTGTHQTTPYKACIYEGSPKPSPHHKGSMLVTGYVHLDDKGVGVVGVTKREPRTWADAGGSINTIRLPRVYVEGGGNDCLRGTGNLGGPWRGAPERTLSMTMGVSELEFAKIEAFPKPDFKSQTDNWHLGLAWGVGATSNSALALEPYYTIESPGTKDRATFTLFVAAVLLGASITVLFEMIRDIPSGKRIEPSPASLPSSAADPKTASSPASAPDPNPASVHSSAAEPGSAGSPASAPDPNPASVHSSAAEPGSAGSAASAPKLSGRYTPTPSKPFRISSRRPPKRWRRKR